MAFDVREHIDGHEIPRGHGDGVEENVPRPWTARENSTAQKVRSRRQTRSRTPRCTLSSKAE